MLSNLTEFETEERATARLAKSFEPNSWLKAIKLNESNLSPSDNVTSLSQIYELHKAFRVPNAKIPKVEGFVSEQEFEGLVVAVSLDQKSFWARLIDISGYLPDEEAEFDFKEIPSDDWSLIVPGALFSWNIGLETRNRQARRVTEIRFRRFFQFSSLNIQTAEQEAFELEQLIRESNFSE